MFGWFKPACPLATAEKVWVESRMAWLTTQLGVERLHGATVIEPTADFFPAPYEAGEANARSIFQLVCQWMEVDCARVSMEIHERIDAEDSLGLYMAGEPARILIKYAQLVDPESLVATMAHELAHEILLGGGLLQDNNEDLERLTDLTTVFLGLGLFSANAKIREKTERNGNVSWWSISKQGYLPLRMYGYGLSLFAWARNETRPAWMKHLRLDAHSTMQKGLHYLTKTGDSVFHPACAEQGDASDSSDAATTLLSHESRSFRYHGLLQLIDQGGAPAAAIDTIAELTDDRDPDISSLAAMLLGVVGQAAARHASRLLDMCSHSAALNRQRAAWSLGQIRPAEPGVLRELIRLLEDDRADVREAAAEALGNYGLAAEGAAKPLLRRFQQTLIKGDAGPEHFAMAIVRIVPDARQRVREHFAEIDGELCRLAEECVDEVAMPSDEDETAQPANSPRATLKRSTGL